MTRQVGQGRSKGGGGERRKGSSLSPVTTEYSTHEPSLFTAADLIDTDAAVISVDPRQDQCRDSKPQSTEPRPVEDPL